MPAKETSRFGKAFIAYGSYHYDTTNKIIHIICIPLITATLFSLLSFLPLNISLPSVPFFGAINIGAAQLLAIIGVIYYVYLNAMFGLLAGAAIYFLSILWKSFFINYTQSEMFQAVFLIQIVAWALQFVGHGVFEKRKPALLDNITQILNAPMFVLIQLCEIFGLKNEQIDGWKKQIKKNVDQFRSISQGKDLLQNKQKKNN